MLLSIYKMYRLYFSNGLMIIKRKVNQTNAISFVAQMAKLTCLLKTKKYITIHAKISKVLDLTQNLPLTLTLMTFAKNQILN